MGNYVLITAARNEESYIGATLEGVIRQTVLPVKWIIVSDGSTDATDKIVASYAREYSFIELIRRDPDKKRNFGSKAAAVNFAYQSMNDIAYDYLGNLDADVSVEPEFYEKCMKAFESNPRLGVAGGIRYDLWRGAFRKMHCARNSVGGPFQFFRRQCFEDIEGYRVLPCGGIDAVAETMARMHGWQVESFPHIRAYHHRLTGTEGSGYLRSRFKAGIRDYLIGYHPVFETLRILRNAAESPIVIGSAYWFGGFVWAAITCRERPVPEAFVEYLRAEQLERMKPASWRQSPS